MKELLLILEELLIIRNKKQKRIRMLKEKQGLSASKYKEISVNGGKKTNVENELSDKICDLEAELIEIDKEIKEIRKKLQSYQQIA